MNKRAAAWYLTAAVIAAIAVAARLLGRDSPISQVVCAAAMSLALYRGAASLYRASQNGKTVKLTLSVIFAVYLLLLINFTIFDGHFGRAATEEMSNAALSEYFSIRGNVVPFRMISRQTRALFAGRYPLRYYAVNVAGNLAAFAPFGVFLPLLFKKCRKFGIFFAVLSFAVLSIETIQLITRTGSFDVDDYILNAAGASIVFALFSTRRGKRLRDRILYPAKTGT